MHINKTVIGAGEFKAHCLHLIDEVSRTGQPLTITKRGKPMVRLEPVVLEKTKARSIIGYMQGTCRTLGDLIAPLDVEWEAMKD